LSRQLNRADGECPDGCRERLRSREQSWTSSHTERDHTGNPPG